VINRNDKSRYAIPFFLGPNHDALVEPVPTCVGPDNPPRYAPTTYGAFTARLLTLNFAHRRGEGRSTGAAAGDAACNFRSAPLPSLFGPTSDRLTNRVGSGRSQSGSYSITSSARARMDTEMVRPKVFAALRFIANS
jgi:hypothetical protein